MGFQGERNQSHYSNRGGHLNRSLFNTALRQAERTLGLLKGDIFLAKRSMRRTPRDGKY